MSLRGRAPGHEPRFVFFILGLWESLGDTKHLHFFLAVATCFSGCFLFHSYSFGLLFFRLQHWNYLGFPSVIMSHRDLLWCRPVAAFDLLQYTRTRGLSIVDLPLSLTWICPYKPILSGITSVCFSKRWTLTILTRCNASFRKNKLKPKGAMKVPLRYKKICFEGSCIQHFSTGLDAWGFRIPGTGRDQRRGQRKSQGVTWEAISCIQWYRAVRVEINPLCRMSFEIPRKS